MCAVTGTPPSLVCVVGDLLPGAEFSMPDGERWMVLGLPKTADSVMVVNIGNGEYNPYGRRADELKGIVTPFYKEVCLGHDHKGRLYASTRLNDWYDYSEPAPAPVPSTPVVKIGDVVKVINSDGGYLDRVGRVTNLGTSSLGRPTASVDFTDGHYGVVFLDGVKVIKTND